VTFKRAGTIISASMTDHEANQDSLSESRETSGSDAGDKVKPGNGDPGISNALEKSNNLTPEEQMALTKNSSKRMTGATNLVETVGWPKQSSISAPVGGYFRSRKNWLLLLMETLSVC